MVLQAQGTGQASAGSGAAPEVRPLPSGTERAEEAFGLFGMMVSSLIILCAVVLLIWRARGRRD
jgi:hypothetical protein